MNQASGKAVKSWTIVCSVLLALLLLLSGLLTIARAALSAEGIESAVSSVDIADIRLPDPKSGQMTDNNAVRLPEYLLRRIDEEFVRSHRLTPEAIEALLRKSDLSEFIAHALGRYTGSLVDGRPVDPLTVGEVVDFVRQNEELIYQELGYRMTQHDYDVLRAFLEENLEEYLGLFGIRTGAVTTFRAEAAVVVLRAQANAAPASGALSGAIALARRLLSGWMLFAVCALAAVLLAVLVLLNRRAPLVLLRALAVMLCALALVFGLLTLGIVLLPYLLSQPQVGVLLAKARTCALLQFVVYLLLSAGAMTSAVIFTRKEKKGIENV